MQSRWNPHAGILAGPVNGAARARAAYPEVAGVPGIRLVHRASGFAGVLVRLLAGGAEIRGSSGLERVFRTTPGAFEVEGRVVTLVKPPPNRSRAPARTASGSVAVARLGARTARASRILVEGVHDAELVEQVWGDDLRVEGVVVERLDGLDHLAEAVAEFDPAPGRRLGVLVDHLLPGTKEQRLASAVAHPHVLVTGTPFVDVWQAVRPSAVGIAGWPPVPLGTDWKAGVCARLGWPAPPEAWRRIRGSVRSYADLEPALVGAVEQLIDFVTEGTGSE